MPQKVRDIMKYRKISLVCLFTALPISIINSLLGIRFLTILGILLLLIFFTMAIILWRCPRCKKRLPLRFNKETDINDIYRCPYCNSKFLDGYIID